MKILLIFALLLIVYSLVTSIRRASGTFGQYRAKQRESAHIDKIMKEFGNKRVRLGELRVGFTELVGVSSIGNPSWNFVETCVNNSHAALKQFKFEQAFHYMSYAVDHAERIVEDARRNAVPVDPSII